MRKAAAAQTQPMSRAVHDLCASRLLSLLGGAVRAGGGGGKGSESKGGKVGGDAAAVAEEPSASAAEDALGQVSAFVDAAHRSKATNPANAPSEGQARVAAALKQAQPAAAGAELATLLFARFPVACRPCERPQLPAGLVAFDRIHSCQEELHSFMCGGAGLVKLMVC